jgi:hypothetical protein
VHDAPLMEVRYSLQQVNHDGLRLLQSGKAVFLDVAVEGEWVKLQYDVRGIVGLEY